MSINLDTSDTPIFNWWMLCPPCVLLIIIFLVQNSANGGKKTSRFWTLKFQNMANFTPGQVRFTLITI